MDGMDGLEGSQGREVMMEEAAGRVNGRVLFVDDDESLLDSIKLAFRMRYDVNTATGPAPALAAIREEPPFGVVVSDLRMPAIDGLAFMARVKEIVPDTMRIMLTGYADMDTAVEAINRGEVFRFLTKPCLTETLSLAIDEGLRIYNAILSQRILARENREQRIRLENIIQAANAAVWEWDLPSGRVEVNERWARMIGCAPGDLASFTRDQWTALIHPEDLSGSQAALAAHFAGQSPAYSMDLRLRHKNGDWVWVRDHGQVIRRDGDGQPLSMTGTHIDITDMKRHEQELIAISIRDPLTGVFNRRHCLDLLSKVVLRRQRNPGRFCVAILDLDHFKKVNDTHGHLAGDATLTWVAGLLSRHTRAYDTVGRYGGEEFLILFEETGRKNALGVLARIQAILREKALNFEGREIRATFSCGLVDSRDVPQAELNPESLIALADRRMYAAKTAGRDRIVSDG